LWAQGGPLDTFYGKGTGAPWEFGGDGPPSTPEPSMATVGFPAIRNRAACGRGRSETAARRPYRPMSLIDLFC